MTRLLLLPALLLAVSVPTQAQITLSPGDLALTFVNTDTPDGFAFVALTDIPAGTEILFADCGVQSDGTFRGGEGAISYVVPAGGLSAGDEAVFEDGASSSGFTEGEDGGAGCTGTFALSTSGDQVVVYQTDDAGTTQYLYIVDLDGGDGFASNATNSNNTALPPGLTDGTTAVDIDPEVDNAIYDGSLQTGTPAELLAAIGDEANWNGSNSAITYSASTFSFMVSTMPTITQPLVFTTPGEDDTAAAYRLLSPPVEGFLIDDLADLNLVQGVDAGTMNEEQYPNFGDNVFVSLGGNTRLDFVPPVDTDEEIRSGQGFFWYLYDRTFDPSGGGNGTSQSVELTGFELSATGTVPTSDVTFMPPNYAIASGTRAFLIGNPFDEDLNVSGITSTPARQTVIQTWDPQGTNSTGDVVGGFQAFEAGTANEVLAVWQGAYAELSDLTAAPTFTYAASARTGSQSAPFYGRPAAISNAIALRLSGRTEAGTPVGDNLAVVRFAQDASAEWDLRDASKLLPPVADLALLAPTTLRDGSPWRTAVNTLPEGDVVVPVEFTTSGAGTFTVDADVTLSGGTRAILRDRLTGDEIDLATESYTFTAGETDWTERFELSVSFAVVANEQDAAAGFRLSAPTPNPTRGTARLVLSVGTAQDVQVAVFDALGREVAVLHDGPLASGTAEALSIETSRLAPGVYVVRAQGDIVTRTQRLTVTR
ncbi:MAG: T9SS type A sorting domain-containing protein [Bacteroidota bacterium]